MAWIDAIKRADGGTSYSVRWRLGGTRSGPRQTETFGAGSDEQNAARAEGFRRMVVAAGESWPDGWVKGEGFIRDRPVAADPLWPPRSLSEVGEAYVDQIVDCSPGQRARYRSQIRILSQWQAPTRATRRRPFDGPVDQITEADVRGWLLGWNRAAKTKANYHGLLSAILAYAVEQGDIAVNPCQRTAPRRSTIRQSQGDLRFLTETDFVTAAQAAGPDGDLLRVAVGTGMRFGELTALWVSDVDLSHRTVRVNKAWKRNGDEGAQAVPPWLRKQLRAKHAMRGHHLGNPKTAKSRRTITISSELAQVLRAHLENREGDDFVFTTPTGLAIHNGDFSERVWTPLMGELRALRIPPFRFHDLRHTHVAWLIAGGVPLPHIQAPLGHESITTTIDTYGHLLPVGNTLISDVIDVALRGGLIRPEARSADTPSQHYQP